MDSISPPVLFPGESLPTPPLVDIHPFVLQFQDGPIRLAVLWAEFIGRPAFFAVFMTTRNGAQLPPEIRLQLPPSCNIQCLISSNSVDVPGTWRRMEDKETRDAFGQDMAINSLDDQYRRGLSRSLEIGLGLDHLFRRIRSPDRIVLFILACIVGYQRPREHCLGSWNAFDRGDSVSIYATVVRDMERHDGRTPSVNLPVATDATEPPCQSDELTSEVSLEQVAGFWMHSAENELGYPVSSDQLQSLLAGKRLSPGCIDALGRLIALDAANDGRKTTWVDSCAASMILARTVGSGTSYGARHTDTETTCVVLDLPSSRFVLGVLHHAPRRILTYDPGRHYGNDGDYALIDSALREFCRPNPDPAHGSDDYKIERMDWPQCKSAADSGVYIFLAALDLCMAANGPVPRPDEHWLTHGRWRDMLVRELRNGRLDKAYRSNLTGAQTRTATFSSNGMVESDAPFSVQGAQDFRRVNDISDRSTMGKRRAFSEDGDNHRPAKAAKLATQQSAQLAVEDDVFEQYINLVNSQQSTQDGPPQP